MSLGEIIESDKAAVLRVGILILIAASVMGLSGCGKKKAGNYTRWYYDLESGEQLEYSTPDDPPVTLDNGHEGVVAHVYGCDGCSGETFLGYLERFDPSLDKSKRHEGSTTGVGIQVAQDPVNTDNKVQWFDRDSQDGFYVIGLPREKCQGSGHARECFPGRE